MIELNLFILLEGGTAQKGQNIFPQLSPNFQDL